MKYLLLVYHNEDRFNRIPEGTRKDMLAESIQLCHQLASKGQYVHASPLQPEATGAMVRVRDGKPTMTDGPFMETKEQLAGYFLVDDRGSRGSHQNCRTSAWGADRHRRSQTGDRHLWIAE